VTTLKVALFTHSYPKFGSGFKVAFKAVVEETD